MKKFLASIIILIILSLFNQTVFSQPLYNGSIFTENNKYLSAYQKEPENSDIIKGNIAFEKTYENPIRRFEITFFISAPFTFIISYLILNSYDITKHSIKKKKYDGNVNVWKDYKYALLTGTFGLSTAIAFREAWICIKTNREMESGQKEQTISLYFRKNF